MKVKELIALLAMFDKEARITIDDVNEVFDIVVTETTTVAMEGEQVKTNVTRSNVNINTRDASYDDWR